MREKIDLLSGGFPCQAFSHSGKRLGFEDTRGTLFYEFARAIKEIKPTCFLAENVKGLLSHDNGNTIKTIIDVFSDLGYFVFSPLLLNANDYEVAQKRERIFLFGVKKELEKEFTFNEPVKKNKITLRDIFEKNDYYLQPIPSSKGVNYSEVKKKIF